MSERRFPPPWTVEKIPGGLKVSDANGQSLAYVYSRENPNEAHMAKVLTEDEARTCSMSANDPKRTRLQRDHPNGASLGTIAGIGKVLGFHCLDDLRKRRVIAQHQIERIFGSWEPIGLGGEGGIRTHG